MLIHDAAPLMPARWVLDVQQVISDSSWGRRNNPQGEYATVLSTVDLLAQFGIKR